MVASRQLEYPFYRGFGRQRARGFGALAKFIGRTAFPILRKYIVPAAKHVGAELLQFDLPGNAEVVFGSKNLQTGAKSVGGQTLRKQVDDGSRKLKANIDVSHASRVNPTKSTKQTRRSRSDHFTNISL